MQREIKFRVWDTYRNKMIKWDELHSDSNYLCLMVFDGNGYRTRAMQYTGLKDKNGREIYEGDILQREGCWNVRIEFEKGVFWVRDANKVRYNNKILNTPIASFQIETFEVIGNVWQNPELLEGVN